MGRQEASKRQCEDRPSHQQKQRAQSDQLRLGQGSATLHFGSANLDLSVLAHSQSLVNAFTHGRPPVEGLHFLLRPRSNLLSVTAFKPDVLFGPRLHLRCLGDLFSLFRAFQPTLPLTLITVQCSCVNGGRHSSFGVIHVSTNSCCVPCSSRLNVRTSSPSDTEVRFTKNPFCCKLGGTIWCTSLNCANSHMVTNALAVSTAMNSFKASALICVYCFPPTLSRPLTACSLETSL